MAAPAPRLHVVAPVDRETGEIRPVTIEGLQAENEALKDELSELVRKFKGQSRELAEVRRDKQAEAEADPLWPLAVRLFAYHSKACNHPKAEWTAERFAMVRKLRGRKSPAAWLEECLRAISGLASDPWRKANGMTMWEDCFESRKKFERALEKCPEDWTPPPGVESLLA